MDKINSNQEKRIESVMKKSGWTYDEVKASMKAARRAVGIKSRDYDRYDFWKVPEEEWEAEIKRIEEKKAAAEEKQEAIIASVMEKSGWSYDEAYADMKLAKQELSLRFSDYDKYDFWEIPKVEWSHAYNYVLSRKERSKKKDNENIQQVMENTGWDRESSLEALREAKKRLGVSFTEYNQHQLYKYDHEEQKKIYDAVLEKRAEEETNAVIERRRIRGEKKEETVQKIMAATGWDHEKTVEKVEDARKRTGCAYKEFYMYKFDELDEKTQEELLLMVDSRKVIKKYDVNRYFRRMLTNKELTNETFSKYLNRPWCVNTKITEDEFVERFKDSTKIFYKPLAGNRGIGVASFDIDEKNIRDVYGELAKLPDGVVEEYVLQHEKMSQLAPSSVNTIRVVTISSNSKPVNDAGEHIDVAYAALRIGGGNSIVDNFHSGGMVAVVDLETGRLVTDAADMERHVYKEHPVTGVTIKGFEIPMFDEVIKMIKSAYEDSHIEGYLGWDVAITEKGPVLIEINLQPGVVLLTTPYIAEKKGMKHVMTKYL